MAAHVNQHTADRSGGCDTLPARARPRLVVADMPEPLISVIMPARDAAATIATAVASVQAQTEGRWELIVVDDGSGDVTGDLVAAAMPGEPRLHLLRLAPGGVARARNAGIAHARAPIVTFLDADDEVSTSWLATLSGPFTDPDVAVSCCAARRSDGRLDHPRSWGGLLGCDAQPLLGGDVCRPPEPARAGWWLRRGPHILREPRAGHPAQPRRSPQPADGGELRSPRADAPRRPRPGRAPRPGASRGRRAHPRQVRRPARPGRPHARHISIAWRRSTPGASATDRRPAGTPTARWPPPPTAWRRGVSGPRLGCPSWPSVGAGPRRSRRPAATLRCS